MKQKKPLDNKFVSFKGFNAVSKGALTSEMYLRSQRETSFVVVNPAILDPRLPANMTVSDLVQNKQLSVMLQPVVQDAATFNAIQDRELKAIINDSKIMNQIDPSTAQVLTNLIGTGNIGKNLRHRVKSNNNGQLKYAIKSKLNQLLLTTPLKTGETNTLNSNDLGTSSSVLEYKTGENKLVKLEIENKLGVGKDKMKIIIDKIPADISRSLQFNIKPGIGGVDICTAGADAKADVFIQTTINGKVTKSDYTVKLDGGVRLRPSTVLTNNELKVGQVDTLFGQLLKSTMLKSKS